ncbi:MAG: hypothetical protein ACPGVD_04410, partial [Flavobacteriales bacterium]
LAIKAYPRAFNLYDSYGEILLNLGDTVNAIKNYKRSIELNPKNNHGIEMLKKITTNTLKIEKPNFNILNTDSTWGQEIFIFPIHFAPEIKHEGFEDIRFAPGWAKRDSVDFWTYVFAWSIKQNSEITSQTLENELKLYFDGLMKVVNDDKDFIVPKTIVEIVKIKEKFYSGKMMIYDGFTTKDSLVLNVNIEHFLSEKENKSILVFRFSPKNFNHNIWKELYKISINVGIKRHYK